MSNKKKLRQHFINIRNNGNFHSLDTILINSLRKTLTYKSSQKIMIYYPIGSEINLLPLLNDKKEFCFPKLTEEGIIPVANGENFTNGKYNIPEPSETKETPIENIDLIIVPALCVDKNGNRIGYGKGYYDSFIKKFDRNKTKFVVLIYDDFIVEKIDTEIFDEKIDIIISEKRIIEP